MSEPAEPTTPQAPQAPQTKIRLPPGWEAKESKSRPGVMYFVNAKTGESRWEPPEVVRCMHIVVKHAKSRRPASWRSDNITRSPEEAEQIVLGIRNELINLSGDELKHAFAEKAKTESDCNSAQRGGDLGHFGRGQMQPAFEEVAFALQVGQLSDLVQTDSGVHVILRTE